MRGRLVGIVLSVLAVLSCTQPKPRPDTRESARRAHEELDREATAERDDREKRHRYIKGTEGSQPSPEIAPLALDAPAFDKTKPCIWREAEGVVGMGEHDTPYQAKGRAVAMARKNAIKDVLGYEIRARDAIFEQQSLAGQQMLVESLITSTQSGLILDEKVLEAAPVASPQGALNFRVRLQTCIARQPDRMDKGFRVSLDLNRQTFVDGDNAVATISVTRDACVYLLNVDQDGNWALVFPNDYATENCTTPARPIEYPDSRLHRMGVHMRAELPGGHRISQEVLRVIAFRTKMDHLFKGSSGTSSAAGDSYETGYEANVGKFGELARRLVADEVEWVDDVYAFVIHAK